jgi:hypothetical protein
MELCSKDVVVELMIGCDSNEGLMVFADLLLDLMNDLMKTSNGPKINILFNLSDFFDKLIN